MQLTHWHWKIGLLIFAAAAVVTARGRWSDVSSSKAPSVQPLDLEEALESFLLQEISSREALIDGAIDAWGWEEVEEDGTGLRWTILETNAAAVPLGIQEGELQRWAITIRLMDGTELIRHPAEDPLVFRWQHDDVPSGFHGLAAYLNCGDSAEALIPPHLAWGMRGARESLDGKGAVPPGAIIWAQIRVLK